MLVRTFFFQLLIDVNSAPGSVRQFVVGNEVNLVLCQERVIQGPRGIPNNLISVATMSDAFVSFIFRHDGLP